MESLTPNCSPRLRGRFSEISNWCEVIQPRGSIMLMLP
jgi:hypothetical protein